MMKTLMGWKKAGNLSDYLRIGDEVNEALRHEFTDVEPPLYYTNSLIQMGEPVRVINDEFVYYTLVKRENKWIYAGMCLEGSNNPEPGTTTGYKDRNASPILVGNALKYDGELYEVIIDHHTIKPMINSEYEYTLTNDIAKKSNSICASIIYHANHGVYTKIAIDEEIDEWLKDHEDIFNKYDWNIVTKVVYDMLMALLIESGVAPATELDQFDDEDIEAIKYVTEKAGGKIA